MYIWPPHFPNQCPPADATDASGKLFRLIKENPATEFDFLSYFERFPSKPNHDECKSRGLSVCKTVEDLKELQKAVPALRDRVIAEANLATGMGLLKNTPSKNCTGHCTWWRAHSASAVSALFTQVNIE